MAGPGHACLVWGGWQDQTNPKPKTAMEASASLCPGGWLHSCMQEAPQVLSFPRCIAPVPSSGSGKAWQG